MNEVDILSFGAVGDGCSLDTAAIQAAIDHVANEGGGTVIIPSGKRFLCGGVVLKSYVNLELKPGSVLLASTRREDYEQSRFSCVIEACEAQCISITGFGRIEGSGFSFVKRDLKYIYEPEAWRPGMICLLDCNQVTLRDLFIEDSPWWTVHLIGCSDALVDAIKIRNNLKMPNCDGMDPIPSQTGACSETAAQTVRISLPLRVDGCCSAWDDEEPTSRSAVGPSVYSLARHGSMPLCYGTAQRDYHPDR